MPLDGNGPLAGPRRCSSRTRGSARHNIEPAEKAQLGTASSAYRCHRASRSARAFARTSDSGSRCRDSSGRPAARTSAAQVAHIYPYWVRPGARSRTVVRAMGGQRVSVSGAGGPPAALAEHSVSLGRTVLGGVDQFGTRITRSGARGRNTSAAELGSGASVASRRRGGRVGVGVRGPAGKGKARPSHARLLRSNPDLGGCVFPELSGRRARCRGPVTRWRGISADDGWQATRTLARPRRNRLESTVAADLSDDHPHRHGSPGTGHDHEPYPESCSSAAPTWSRLEPYRMTLDHLVEHEETRSPGNTRGSGCLLGRRYSNPADPPRGARAGVRGSVTKNPVAWRCLRGDRRNHREEPRWGKCGAGGRAVFLGAGVAEPLAVAESDRLRYRVGCRRQRARHRRFFSERNG